MKAVLLLLSCVGLISQVYGVEASEIVTPFRVLMQSYQTLRHHGRACPDHPRATGALPEIFDIHQHNTGFLACCPTGPRDKPEDDSGEVSHAGARTRLGAHYHLASPSASA